MQDVCGMSWGPGSRFSWRLKLPGCPRHGVGLAERYRTRGGGAVGAAGSLAGGAGGPILG